MKTIQWRKNKVRIIDQTKLPLKLAYLDLDNLKSMWWAIRKLKVRGAPAIGIAAGFGVVLGMRNSHAKTSLKFKQELKRVTNYLRKARPTAVNLFWALERMERQVFAHHHKSPSFLKELLLKEALKITQEDRDICRRMGRFGAGLVKKNDVILTHCNAGALATADYGTALGVIYEAKKQGKKLKVYADETRPVLQGARLTSWELMKNKIDVTLICDNMAAQLMKEGKIDKIFVGADRIAANGDAANKIGTYSLAVLADFHKIPFYVVAPVSTFDFCLKSGKDIPIEQRNPQEVREVFGKQVAPKNVKVYNPAFDVTPNSLISAIITERGILRKPYERSLRRLK
ncbi:MAG: S-methyl-5-thioribose-1-phosphate isomerase [Candidatus Omnitrophota bacterium]|nr:MAG: S-methyl-5-thioribose-1-phosphate isomerase [Candidatus Omnitrophota bacterium]